MHIAAYTFNRAKPYTASKPGTHDGKSATPEEPLSSTPALQTGQFRAHRKRNKFPEDCLHLLGHHIPRFYNRGKSRSCVFLEAQSQSYIPIIGVPRLFRQRYARLAFPCFPSMLHYFYWMLHDFSRDLNLQSGCSCELRRSTSSIQRPLLKRQTPTILFSPTCVSSWV
ncbi:hypothetical protein KSP39_PZI010577 [Platanthera zijinensis]|uniref:Uncharacterized protein n=1 Tax=Platanthera zijinensis TaxID=2320716 RepID=A0AAP0G780_9ASPA